MEKYQDLRNEVRAFCPDAIWQSCKAKEQLDSFERIKLRMDEFFQKNPDSYAMVLRKKYYQVASEEAVPKRLLVRVDLKFPVIGAIICIFFIDNCNWCHSMYLFYRQ